MKLINRKKNIINKVKLEKNIFSNKYICCYCENTHDIEFMEKLNDDKFHKCLCCGSTFIQLNDTNYFLTEPSEQIQKKLTLMKKKKRLKSIIFYSSLCITCISIFGLFQSSYIHNILLFQITYITFIISLICTLIMGANRSLN